MTLKSHEIAIQVFDLTAACLGLFLLSPLLVVVALLTKLTSPGPVLYKAPRVGRGGQIFTPYKFRSMVHNPAAEGSSITTRDDSRITPLGRILRKTKIDELPQLINVVKGEMSLVGPRPETPEYVRLLTQEQRRILTAKPGITSPASVAYRHEERLLAGPDFERVYRLQILPHKVALDLAYLERRTFWTHLATLLRTFAALFRSTQPDLASSKEPTVGPDRKRRSRA